MKFRSILYLFLAVLGVSCSANDAYEMPPYSIGGGGFKPMDGKGGTPAEQYEEAYSWLRGLHLKVQNHLTQRKPNFYAASQEMRSLMKRLHLMHSLLQDPAQTNLGTYIAKYTKILHSIEEHRATGATADKLSDTEKDIRDEFYPGRVPLVAQLPGAKANGTTTTASPANDDTLPPPPGSDLSEKQPDRVPPIPENPDHPSWILYKGWQQLHRELIETFQADKDCSKPYSRLQKILAQLAAAFPKESTQNQLKLCQLSYQAAHEQTSGFSKLPEGTTRKNIIEELELPARMIRRYCDPDLIAAPEK